MNLLAHLHLGRHLTPLAEVANLTADFCRESGTPEFERGRRFHQAIDSFTDSHEIVLRTRQLFSSKLTRFSSVVLDVAFDNCLSKTWMEWSPLERRRDFIHRHLLRMQKHSGELPVTAALALKRIKDESWLQNYVHLEGIEDAFRRIVQRRPQFSPLLGAVTEIDSNFDRILDGFCEFYPDILEHAHGHSVD